MTQLKQLVIEAEYNVSHHLCLLINIMHNGIHNETVEMVERSQPHLLNNASFSAWESALIQASAILQDIADWKRGNIQTTYQQSFVARPSPNYLFVYRLYRLPQIHSPTDLLMPLHFFVHFFDILFWYIFLVYFYTLSDTLSDTLFIRLFVRLFIHLWVHFGKTFDILFNALFKHFPRHFSEDSLYTHCTYICKTFCILSLHFL